MGDYEIASLAILESTFYKKGEQSDYKQAGKTNVSWPLTLHQERANTGLKSQSALPIVSSTSCQLLLARKTLAAIVSTKNRIVSAF